MEKLWFVNSGPDKSHFTDCKVFLTRKESFKFAKNLSLTPYGKPRPYTIYRHNYTYSASHYNDQVTTTCIATVGVK